MIHCTLIKKEKKKLHKKKKKIVYFYKKQNKTDSDGQPLYGYQVGMLCANELRMTQDLFCY